MCVVIPITLFLAWAITRTNMPLRRVMEALIVCHIFLPFLPLVMSWAVLASPRAGLLNVGIRNLSACHIRRVRSTSTRTAV